MASAVLVDSCHYITLQRRGVDPLAHLAARVDDFEFMTCGMVLMEILRGIHTPRVAQRYRDAFAVMVCVPTTSLVWDRATNIALTLDRAGTPIPPQDALIAAHALQAGASILTLDLHFRKISGLTVVTDFGLKYRHSIDFSRLQLKGPRPHIIARARCLRSQFATSRTPPNGPGFSV